MTKTQTQLLELARTYGGKYSITTGYGRGPKGGKISFGMRQRDALFALEDAGLVVITDRQPWQDYHHGYGQSGNSIAFKLK
jgi:hypothetical protein